MKEKTKKILLWVALIWIAWSIFTYFLLGFEIGFSAVLRYFLFIATIIIFIIFYPLIDKFLIQTVFKSEKNTEKKSSNILKSITDFLIIFLVLIFLLIPFGIWMAYGSLHPCHILEKDFNRILDEGTPGAYLLFDTSAFAKQITNKLSPFECLMIKVYGEQEEHLRDELRFRK